MTPAKIEKTKYVKGNPRSGHFANHRKQLQKERKNTNEGKPPAAGYEAGRNRVRGRTLPGSAGPTKGIKNTQRGG